MEGQMGLLDDLLGGLAGQGAAAGRAREDAAPSAGGGGMGQVLTALMPVVLSMLASRRLQGAGGQAGSAPQGGGGLGGILGQVLGGAGGGAAGGGAGGLGGLLEQLQRAGYGEQARSWVGRGENQPISPDAMSQIFGREGLQQISHQAGLSEEQTSRGLSQLLPEMVDRVTPEGQVPDADALSNSVDDFARRLGLR
jgi:uncharacterized protein YidB (DUF937 family)